MSALLFSFCNFDSPSSLGPVFTFRLPAMADTVAVTLGFMGWASVSMTTTIWAVCRDTLLKDLAFTRAEACWWGSEREWWGLGRVLEGEERGVEALDDGLLVASQLWLGMTFFR